MNKRSPALASLQNMFSTLVLVLVVLNFDVYLAIQANALSGITHVPPVTSVCHDTCGLVPVKYPFGIGFGCGHPNFARYIKCVGEALQFSTNTGVYAISSIDYTANTIVVTDSLMSTCASMQNSGSFGLDPDAPFTTQSNDIFVLLGCSSTSPVYDLKEDLCDSEDSHVCRGLYSCKGVTGIGLEPNGPTKSCCVYDPPMGVGSGYQLDLPKLQCSSYTCVYGYGDNEGDPNKWNYGISLRFNGTDRVDVCKQCESSAGTCGFRGFDGSFVCVCRNGVNTTSNCYGQVVLYDLIGYTWNSSWRQDKAERFSILGLFLFWIALFIGRR
ncbi:wall-associated receptor kinase-like protein 8 isoform X1 [Cinnamomum micranthum f. kanehirae]|uniref:Wall-associated receptor kinase-like protein 8 isoform X1 n=1 Tax=Cinnamomum micranthum f. kanehirae TaxID=337451 RepID=A0A443NFE8_9MAGN|nr:wall-associated receptor kinase-like protein 8 isoform X1 [Cinnamomum micranthum f. kanehirae]